ncbi:hypothetical protein VCRA2123O444_80140 [Vibrio crassostreae]|nr:hypothetical protein VCRA2117O428_100140 [Vibrio crassostreae]CAK1706885.1 hypothetical protein VCRA2113O416_100141 [Vibrio crassostreae]CAK1833014.1 hypothetical protein VCRA2110O182_10222 [Vibrio crassostreae]CAK1886672.1 hypothetical protein VCRA2118O429_10573 [Vibrio crassostreae]CAK1968761.1 hypothetical protein VCRA2119O432_20024 [Vibrio crassostreae]
MDKNQPKVGLFIISICVVYGLENAMKPFYLLRITTRIPKPKRPCCNNTAGPWYLVRFT